MDWVIAAEIDLTKMKKDAAERKPRIARTAPSLRLSSMSLPRDLSARRVTTTGSEYLGLPSVFALVITSASFPWIKFINYMLLVIDFHVIYVKLHVSIFVELQFNFVFFIHLHGCKKYYKQTRFIEK